MRSDLFGAHVYLLLIPLAIAEGPLLAIAVSVGAAFGYVDPFLAAIYY